MILMSHVGTRAEHLFDLYDLWNEGLTIMERSSYHSVFEKTQMDELKAALKLLSAHMQKDYSSTPYARVINDLKKAEDISDVKSSSSSDTMLGTSDSTGCGIDWPEQPI